MNESIDLTKILKDCPEGTKFYSSIFGDVEFMGIDNDNDNQSTITLETECGALISVESDGKSLRGYKGECTLFPSKEQRDWSKFTVPWYKKGKFDPSTLKPFDKVLTKPIDIIEWRCDLFSHALLSNDNTYYYSCIGLGSKYCIPYNDETKHLVGTEKEAPEYYRYWED